MHVFFFFCISWSILLRKLWNVVQICKYFSIIIYPDAFWISFYMIAFKSCLLDELACSSDLWSAIRQKKIFWSEIWNTNSNLTLFMIVIKKCPSRCTGMKFLQNLAMLVATPTWFCGLVLAHVMNIVWCYTIWTTNVCGVGC